MQTHRPLPWFFLAFAVLAADQAAKSTIDAATPLGWSHPVTSFFNLVHVLNPGAAFSFLAGAGGWQRWFFLAIAIVASVWLIWMLRQPRPRSESLAFSLILGGALGNAFDRAVRGHVIDYLDFHLGAWHWPAFNFADIAITVGAAILVLASFIGSQQTNVRENTWS
jgi:signal peptidase II